MPTRGSGWVCGPAGKALPVAALLAALVPATVEPAAAQSLLQRLFGYGGSRTLEYGYGRGDPHAYSSPRDGYGDWQEDRATYRTLCVRLCDGFYFPISDSVRRGRLYQDNRACLSRCDGEARLYYYPTAGGSVETMVDLAGRSYASLPNAFKYRKTLVAGCACRPAPWSAEAMVRHRGYAAEEAQRLVDAEVEAQGRRARAASIAEPYYAAAEDLGEEGDDRYAAPRYVPAPRSASRMSRTPWSRNPFARGGY